MRRFYIHFCLLLLFAALLIVSATATAIGSESRAVKRDRNRTGISVGISANEELFGSGKTHPLTINFASSIHQVAGFLVHVEDAATYAISGNGDDSVVMPLISIERLSTSMLSLTGAGLNSIDRRFTNANRWSFAIDKLTITPAPPTPEASWMLLTATEFIFLGYYRCPK